MLGTSTVPLDVVWLTDSACTSHDWGTQVCYEAARMRPDIFERVIGTCIPVCSSFPIFTQ